MNIVALVGSNRKESYNLKLAAYMQERYQERIDIDIVSIKELPFFPGMKCMSAPFMRKLTIAGH